MIRARRGWTIGAEKNTWSEDCQTLQPSFYQRDVNRQYCGDCVHTEHDASLGTRDMDVAFDLPRQISPMHRCYMELVCRRAEVFALQNRK